MEASLVATTRLADFQQQLVAATIAAPRKTRAAMRQEIVLIAALVMTISLKLTTTLIFTGIVAVASAFPNTTPISALMDAVNPIVAMETTTVATVSQEIALSAKTVRTDHQTQLQAAVMGLLQA